MSVYLIIAFALGADFGASLCMAAHTVGHWQRHDGRPVVRFGRGHEREISYVTAFVALTVLLPIFMVHDQLRPNHQWIEWTPL